MTEFQPSVPPFTPPPSPGVPARPEPGPPPDPRDSRRSVAADNIEALGTDKVPMLSEHIHCLNIVGQVEGHLVLPAQNKTTKYEHVIPQLVAVEQNPQIEGLLVMLNTVGGDVEAGLAIAEMVASLSKPSVSLVLGGGHSIGVPIAVAASYAFITSTATMTLHPIRLSGLVIGVPQTYEYLDRMQDRVLRFIVRNSRVTEEKLRELMMRTGELARDVGTVLVGKEAVRAGLIDAVGGLREAVSRLNDLILQRRMERGAGDVPGQVQPVGRQMLPEAGRAAELPGSIMQPPAGGAMPQPPGPTLQQPPGGPAL